MQEYGGGVCQVSSTLYNAVLMADLRVTDRTHHSWPLGYVDIGRDATISTGGPNFKFQNTQEVPITIGAQTDKEKKKITISVYGRPLADGVTIQISSKKVETLPEPETEVIVDESLAPGIQQVVREPRRGSVAVTYKEYYDANGNLLHKEQVTNCLLYTSSASIPSSRFTAVRWMQLLPLTTATVRRARNLARFTSCAARRPFRSIS